MKETNESAFVEAEKKRLSRRSNCRREKRPKMRSFPPEFRLRAVRMCVEEGRTQAEVAGLLDISINTLNNWMLNYRRGGGVDAPLFRSPATPRGVAGERPRLPEPVREQIVALKQANLGWGVRRIAQVLRRWFLMQASPETVRRTLHKEQLIAPAPQRPKRNPSKPRFFERATPNQMWQSDIFCFRLGGNNAYLIAFMDDYSRFIVGIDLFRSQTAQAVIEVYRRAAAEFGVPKEMLTDNGRQYAAWRGSSRFQNEMAKDRVSHIRSRPHHPMTLGKVERFWNSIWGEFLGRAQFDDFEQARERIRLWVQHYNHKRPHQGIGGMCPADRFFEIQHELRKTIEEGIRDNTLEMALRGRPQAPFYMVGRMQGQSVVLRAEKGKLKLRVDGEEQTTNHELEYDIQTEIRPDGQSGNPAGKPTDTGETGPASGQDDPQADQNLQPRAEGPGGAGGMDREGQPVGNLPPDADQLRDLPELAGPGDGGDAACLGQPDATGRHFGAQPAVAQDHGAWPPCSGGPAWPQAAPDPTRAGQQPAGLIEDACDQEIQRHLPPTGGGHPASPRGPDHGDRSGTPAGHLPQNLLPVGTAGPQRDARGLGKPQPGTAFNAETRSGNQPLAATGGRTGEPPEGDGGSPRTPWNAGGNTTADTTTTRETQTETPASGT
jgi:transposase InsO family protein